MTRRANADVPENVQATNRTDAYLQLVAMLTTGGSGFESNSPYSFKVMGECSTSYRTSERSRCK